MLYIDINQADLEKKTNQFINDIIDLKNNIYFSATTKLYPIYPKNPVTSHL